MFMPHGHIVSSRLRRTDSTPILGRMLFQAGSLLLVIISVYLLKRIHIFSDKSYKVVQGLVFNLTLPCAIVMSFATNKHPMNLLWLVVFGLFACMIPLFIAYFGSRGDEPRYRAYQMLNASGLNIGAFCLPVVQTFMGPSAGLPVIMLDIGNAIIATAASLTITRSLLHLGSPTKNLPMSLRIKNIALSAWFLLPLDERVREIVVLAAFAPVTIFSTKFTDSLTGNAKLAGFSLTVTAIIGLTFMTILHAVLPVT